MKVLYFHQHFGTPRGAVGTRSYEFAKALIAEGHQVTIVCGNSERAKLSLPDDGKQKWQRAVIDGIEVIVLPLGYSNRDNLARRSLTFLQYAWQSLSISMREDYDLIFATSTPLTAGIPGIFARWIRGKPFVFEVRDLWPELPKALGLRNPLLLAGMSFLEWLTYQSAHACIGLSPGIVQGIRRRSQPNKCVTMIPNGCDLDIFKPGNRAELALPGIQNDDFVAAFTGAHGIANGLDTILDAAAVLKQRNEKRVKLLFIGDGKEKDRLEARSKAEGLDNCLFLPPIAKMDLAVLLGRIDCGLMVLKNVPAFYYGTSPNKFFDYIAAGLPVLNNYPGWLADLIMEHQCGLVTQPDNPEQFADALVYLADHPEERASMAKNGRALAETQFARKQLATQFIAALEKQLPKSAYV